MRLDAYTVVLLRRPPDAPALSAPELDELQRRHIAFNAKMRKAGLAVTTGPFMGQPDESWRGINLFRTSVEETRRLMADDPLVQARRIAFDVFTWLMPAGALGDRPAAQIDGE